MNGQHSGAWVAATMVGGGHCDEVLHAGHSMAPCLQPGDSLSIRALDGVPARGAILVAKLGPRLVAHRLVRWDASAVVLRGDANRTLDPAIDPSCIVGEVVQATRHGRALRLSRTWLQALRVRLS